MAELLVVDDDQKIRDTLQELLSVNYECQTAETAEDALARLESTTFDVVLTDISMPGLSGLELLGNVLQKYPATPVIIISGISDQEHAQGLIRLGAFDYLLKLFNLDDVENSVKRAIEHRTRILEKSANPAQASEKTSQPSDPSDWKIIN